MYTVSYAEQLV